MSSKKSNRVGLVRNLIIGGVLVVAALVVGYGLLYTTGATQGEFVAGEHYQVLDNPTRQRPGSATEVREYFSYGCIHCKNFDPLVDEWKKLNEGTVNFNRIPVAFSPSWMLLAQTYFTFEQLDILAQNHTRLFRRIHDNRQMFATAEDLADFVDGNGASAEEFLRAFNGPEVRKRLRDAENAQRGITISAVPTLVVAGKYVVTMDVGRKVALEVVDHLVALEQSGGQAPES